MSASDSSRVAILVPILRWRRLILDLRRRGDGKRESGAFLLGRMQAGKTVCTNHIYYDDLDPHAYQGDGIAFHAPGCAALWGICREQNIDVLADVHTHPGNYIQQSPIDQRNPMMPTVGHTAMIVPNFGNTPWWSLTGVGIFEYLGHFKWRTHNASASSRVKLTLW